MKTARIPAIVAVVMVVMVWPGEFCEAAPMGTGFTYQGFLYDYGSVADGLYDFDFKLYDANVGGSQRGSTIEVNDCNVWDGHFRVKLDFGSSVFDGNAVWLETTVAQADGCDPCTLEPRLELTPTPYALQTRGMFVDEAGRVGIGTKVPTSGSKLDVRGTVRVVTGSSDNYGVYALTDDDDAVYGYAAGSGNGIYGSSIDGVGVYGITSTGRAGQFIGDVWINNGQIKITGGSPGTGKVLTSDANGLGSWQGALGDGHSLDASDGSPADALYVDNEGRVGIGTTSPDVPLQIGGGTHTPEWTGTAIQIDYDDSAGHILEVHNNAGAAGLWIKADGGSRVGSLVTNKDLELLAGNEVKMTVEGDTGNVGIGTANPSVKLEVDGYVSAFTSGGPGLIQVNDKRASGGAWNLYSGYPTEGDFSINESEAANASRLYIEAGGDVGIGTESPEERLHIRGVNPRILIEATSSSPEINFMHAGDSGWDIWSLYKDVGTNDLRFYQNGNKVTIEYGTGNVGIGTMDPDKKLTVAGTIKSSTGGAADSAVYGLASNTGNVQNYGGAFRADGLRGVGVQGYASATSGINFGVAGKTDSNDGWAGYFEGRGYFSKEVCIGTKPPNAMLDVELPDDSEHSTAVSGINNYTGSEGKLGAGLVGVYGYSPITSYYGVDGYHTGSSGSGVNGKSMYDTGVSGWGQAYDFYAEGPGTNYGSPSSIRWKSNICEIDEPLEKVMSLRGVYFSWDEEHGGQHDVGMIAEEVGEVMPEIVQYEEDGKYTSGMDYSKLTPLLVEAVKKLKGEVDKIKKQDAEKDAELAELREQAARLDLLSKENAYLRERITTLEGRLNQSAGWKEVENEG
jgi:hypothetical protein